MKKLVLSVLLCSAAISSFGQSYTISTVAGSASAGYSGDGGAAVSATLYNPGGVAADASGNFYIADEQNNRIRKVNASGIITTVAGNGTAGFSGDGGSAVSAKLYHPTGVAVDASGNIYIADKTNNRVRKVSSSGTITTVAGNGSAGSSGDGGAATAANLFYPTGVAVDASGNIYIADNSNNKVRKVNTSGTISTFAGTGAASFYGDGGAATAAAMDGPTGVAVSGSLVYIADQGNSRIRVVSSGTISTFAGNGYPTFAGDGGAATAASVNQPYGVAADGSGNVYIADSYSSRIRKVNYSGTITTIAGNSTSWFGGDGGPATAAYLNYVTGIATSGSFVYFADQNNQRVRLLDCTPFAGGLVGPSTVCSGATITLTDSVTGGYWSSGSTAIATVSSTGAVTGLSGGTATISYSVTNGCGTVYCTHSVTVVPVPAGPITGARLICTGSPATLSMTPGGTWGSSATGVATVSATGVVTGVAAGSAIISYSVTNSCGTASDTQAVTVITSPVAGTLTGPSTICIGSPAAFTTTGTGGTWSSSATSTATISASGTATALAVGAATISYAVTNSCGSAIDTLPVTVMALPARDSIATIPATLCVGGTYPLFVTTAGGTWSSTLTTVATVSSGGLVTGVSLGSTIISYTNTNFCGSTADTILLTTHPMPDAGSITGASTVCEGASITLTDTSAGGTWASSSVTNATISASGVVTGIAAGSTIISYSVTNSCGTAAAAYTVTVSPLPTAGNISGPGKVCAGNVITLTDPVAGGTWTSSNSSLAIVSSTGDVGGLTAGSVTISYAKTNICGTAVATHAVIVNIADSCITGIANTATPDASLQVFPNPNEGSFVIKLPLAAQEATIYLLDVMGRVVEQRYVTAFASLNEQFNLQNAAAGNYFIRVVVDGNAYMQRITVQ